ncbi:MAG: anti-sigma factor, partial [Azonexus sp.]
MSEQAITEADLHAYVDGQLPETRRAEVEDYLAAQPEAAARVRAYCVQRDALRQHYDPVLDEEI